MVGTAAVPEQENGGEVEGRKGMWELPVCASGSGGDGGKKGGVIARQTASGGRGLLGRMVVCEGCESGDGGSTDAGRVEEGFLVR